jgi:sec-independent protein translocase protein TatA
VQSAVVRQGRRRKYSWFAAPAIFECDSNSFCGGIMLEGIFQPMHLVVIAGIALLIFGPKKLPEFGKGLGEGIRGFKAAMQAKEETPSQPTVNSENRS